MTNQCEVICSSVRCLWLGGCRIGDVYPDNLVQVRVRMYLYRWADRPHDEGGLSNYEVSHKTPLSLACPSRASNLEGNSRQPGINIACSA